MKWRRDIDAQLSAQGHPNPQVDNPKCVCPNPIAATFCMTGHQLECHFPKDCIEANCSHYQRANAEG